MAIPGNIHSDQRPRLTQGDCRMRFTAVVYLISSVHLKVVRHRLSASIPTSCLTKSSAFPEPALEECEV